MSSFNALTELEELRLFLQERAQEFDESIDASLGSSFDVEVIQPLLTRLGPDPYNTPIREFILGRLATEFPELVLQDGEPIDDLVVKVNQVLLEAFRRQIQQVSLNQSVANPEALNEAEADNLGANFFQARRTGGFSVGVARLFFSAPQFQLVTPSNPVLNSTGLQFFPVENQAITADRMLFNEEDNLFFFDVVVRAEAQGSQYNIDPNQLVKIDGAPSVVKVVNKIKFEEGDDKESTEEFLARVEDSLTEKSLVTTRGINARLLDVFDNVRLLQVIGHGDPEMDRDILTGNGEEKPYGIAEMSASTGDVIELTDATTFYAPLTGNFISGGLRVGDKLQYFRFGTGTLGLISEHTVVQVIDEVFAQVTPDVVVNSSDMFLVRRAEGKITISDIPGGILQPTTPAGTIEINDNEVHLGGHLDVFVRGGEPQQRNTTIEGVLDGQPLRFGVDLESIGNGRLTGGGTDDLVQVTESIAGEAAVPVNDRLGNTLGTLDELVVRRLDTSGTDDAYPWAPSDDDVGRYVQLLGGNGGPDFGTYEILEYLGEEIFGAGDEWSGRVKIDLTDQESGATLAATATPAFDLVVRLIEQVSIKDRVQDKDGSTVVIAAGVPNGGDPVIVGGNNFVSTGVELGDSVVIETGDDAGIYSIRRVLSWLANNDTLILDRELTQTVIPSGLGDGTGLRYRIADDLNIDLVAPRVPKIPLGTVFLGGDLSTVAGSNVVSVTGTTDFLLAGVVVGDTLEISEGDNKGIYGITDVTAASATLDAAPPNTQGNQSFEVYRGFAGIDRPMVRVENVELLDSNSQPTGIEIPYGDVIDARVLGALSNRAEGTSVESFTGALQDNGQGLIDLQDTNTDFVAEDIKAGNRINVLNGLSIGSYTIKYLGPDIPVAEGGPLSVNHIRIDTGGNDAWTSVAVSTHYSIGVPSSGFLRLYFQDPTSAEIATGIAGGRLATEDGKEFRFSEVQGYTLVPSGGSGESNPRDLRTVRSFETGTPGEFNTLLEMTDPTRPGVFELELQNSDIIEVNEQLPFRSTAGSRFDELGVFGPPAGLRTVTGSNLVSVPDNSLIDFTAMDNPANGGPIVGQILIVESGPDAGEYVIESVASAKSLRLNRVMTSFTHEVKGRDINARTGLSLAPSGGKVKIDDTDDAAQLIGGAVGEFITLFESTRGDIDGTYEISDLLPGDPNAIEFDHLGAFDDPAAVVDPLVSGPFTWVRTDQDTNVEQPFNIYKMVAKELSILEVASKRADVVTGPRRATLDLVPSTLTDDEGAFVIGALRGDIVEILEGPSAGIYFLDSDSALNALTIFENPAFPAAGSDVVYRIWGGLHGSRSMATVGPFESDDGNVFPGFQMPYRVRRPGVERVGSTVMQDNFDGFLYFVDVQIESQGSGDELNLATGIRLVVNSGVSVDGYTYSVQNENLTFSVFEEVSLNFDRRFLPVGNSDSPENLTEVSGRNLRISYESSTITRLVNDLMRSDRDRPINASPLARHFLPSFLLASFTYSGGPVESEVGAEMEDFVNRLGALDEIEVSDLEAFLTRRGATSVQHPIELVTVTHDLGRKLVVNRSENKLGGLIEVPYNGTGRISAFFTTLGESLILDRES